MVLGRQIENQPLTSMALRRRGEDAIGNICAEIPVRTGLFGVVRAGKYRMDVVGMLDQDIPTWHDRNNIRLRAHHWLTISSTGSDDGNDPYRAATVAVAAPS